MARTSSSGLWRNRERRLWPRNALNIGRRVKPCLRARRRSRDGGSGGCCSFALWEEDSCRRCWKLRVTAVSGRETLGRPNWVEQNDAKDRTDPWWRHRVCKTLRLGDSIVVREADIAATPMSYICRLGNQLDRPPLYVNIIRRWRRPQGRS